MYSKDGMLNYRGVQTRRTDISEYDCTINVKEDGVTKKSDVEPINQFHLCNSCSIKNFTVCEKVRDIVKKPIALYDFITDGYELVINDDTLDKAKKASLEKCVVSKCKNYVRGY